MNIIDILIIILILFGGLIGFKRGVFRQLISAIGFIVSVILAFLLKNPLSSFLYEHLPFFKFGGLFKGVSVLNIVVYEVIAFLIMLALFTLIFQILKLVTNIIETVLKMTIILSIPSKILGALVGAIQYYVMVFIVLYVLSLPIVSFNLLSGSKFKEPILTKTPILSSFVKKSMDIFDEFDNLKQKYKDTTSSDEFNDEALDLLLKYKVISVNSAQKLIDLNKIEVSDYIINKYKEE